MKRRDFIRISALAGGGLLLSFRAVAKFADGKPVATDADALGDYVKITPQGDVLFQFVKHEMGQGVSTSMAQILAEELCADWERVKIEFPMADKKFEHDTGGSCTIIYQWDRLRSAGAIARQMLVEAAARQWNTPVVNCYAAHHEVINKTTSQRLGFGTLAGAAAKLTPPQEATLKDKRDFQVIGQPKPAKLIPQIVTGQLKYGIDVNLPGMLYAVIARCPVFKGKLKGFDASNALKVKGVKKVFSTKPIAGLQRESPYMPHDIREGVVVVADSFWAARKGRDLLKIEWNEGPNEKYSTEDFEALAAEHARHRTDPTGYVGDENAVADVGRVRKTLRASYVFPHQIHACMEPLNCTAHSHPDGCELWLGTQAPHLIAFELNRVFHFAEDTIKIHLLPSGGGFGRRYYPDMAVEAAFISKEAGHVPVKMMWTREDDHLHNFGHLFQHLEYQVGLDKDNTLYAWYEKEIRTYTWGAQYADPQLPFMAYNIPNIRYDFEDLIPHELVQSSAWRGVVGHGRFYHECFIDEIAADQKIDPYQFRLSLLRNDDVYVGDPIPVSGSRLRRVLMLAAEKGKWGKSLPPGQGMGMAACMFGGSYVAVIAEVTVRDHQLSVDKVTIGVDCGKVINPSGTSNQITGGIVWSLTALFYGGLPIKNGRAVYSNFHQNKLLRMNECPAMEVHFVETDEERPGGVGEISSALGVPAVLNAIFAATGKRIRKVPLRGDAFA